MKDNKLNIKMGAEKLTKEEISSHKDFTKVYKSYTHVKTSWHKSLKKVGGITSAVITVTVIVTVGVWKYAGNTSQSPVKKSATLAAVKTNASAPKQVQHTTRCVNPPLAGVDVPYKSYRVNAEKGGELKYGDNSKISIPKNAFCDKDGKDIKGDVIIQYREFHNPIDFFLSGIPMTYDSAGQQYTFKSAGMLDIKGFKDGMPINIKQDKNIQVVMPSYGKGDKYNTYALDTVKNNWVYMEKTTMYKASYKVTPEQQLPVQKDTSLAEEKAVSIAKSQITKTQQEEKKLEQAKPLQPQKASAASYSFDIHADPKEFPEMSAYKNVLFQVDANDKTFDPKYTKITWEDAALKRNGTSNHYTFSVKKGDESHTFNVFPVFEGTNYDAAIVEYNKKYQEYETALNNRKAEEKKEQDEYKALLKKEEEDAKKAEESAKKAQAAYEKAQADLAKHQLAYSTESGIVSTLTIKKFGIFNCDCPDRCPTGASLVASYIDQGGSDINTECIYLADFGRNSIFRYYPGKTITFDPKVDNIAWCVTPENKVAIYTKDDFKGINKTSGSYTFIMHTHEATLKTSEDVQAFFKPYM